VKNREFPSTVRSKRSCEGVNSKARKGASCRISAFDGWQGKGLSLEIVSSDFPIQWGPSIRAGTGGTRSHGVSVRGFWQQGKGVSWICESLKSRGDVAAWDPRD
jgi:hypothetical protein